MPKPHVTVSTELRVELLLAIARDFGTGIPLDQLLWLMAGPSDPATPREVEHWIEARPHLASVREGVAYLRGHEGTWNPTRRARAERYVECARQFVQGPLAPIRPWVRCLAVTGSVAYGEPEEEDDLDFLTIVRDGALWTFLAYTYLAVRLRRPRGPGAPPTWCFNYALEEALARQEYLVPRGLLYAREALLAEPLVGADVYRGLLRGAPWMAEELPRLYARRAEGALEVGPPPSRTPWPLRLLNVLAFLPVASYLQLQGLVRNWRFRRTGRNEECFRTKTSFRRLAFVSERYDRLIEAYARGMARPRAAVPT